jgi:hypothetical protein
MTTSLKIANLTPPLRDPFGHLWLLSTTIEELTPAEIERRLSK